MAEQPNELRRINWSECFSFTHIFRAFRMAIHPSKLGLGLAGLVLMALWGWILDTIWTYPHLPLPGEVNAFWQVPDVDAWREEAKARCGRELWQAYVDMGEDPKKDWSKAAKFADEPKAVPDALEALHGSLTNAINKKKSEFKEREGKKPDEAEERQIVANVAREKNKIHKKITSLRRPGVFRGLLCFETAAIRQLVDAARVLNFTGGISDVVSARSGGAAAAGSLGTTGGAPDAWSSLTEAEEAAYLTPVRTGPKGIGVLSCVVLMLRGVQWLLVEHLLYAVLFLLGALAIWSLFGGAICRIAALNVARDERISLKTALAFSRKKILGFLTAPLLPLGLILLVGACLFAGGLFMAIPVVGDILGGLGMGLALVGGFVIALVAVGAIAGVGLMWPTIAVEGSDSFDAMSRSYSYVYARPWRAAFYAAVATVYGSLCYLFARFFVLILLKGTRFFVNLGMSFFGTVDNYRPRTGAAGAHKIDALWPHPSFEDLLATRPPFGAEGWGDKAAAWLILVWTGIVVFLLCAFLVTFFLSGSTIIYYLLRKKVDATDLEDLYVEEEEEETPPAAGEEPSPAAMETGEAPSEQPSPPSETSPEDETPEEPSAADESDEP